MNKIIIPSLLVTYLMGSGVWASEALDQLLAELQPQTELTFDADRGAAFWQQTGTGDTSCASCHGVKVSQTGRHATTNKAIEPMAVSVNPQRLTDRKFIDKWLYRNCKAVWSRECTAQEKGDVLTWLSLQ